jgi:hypothetical protein|tara:strand:+ start:879 stop:1256 length:378 start_codon:yes stop_codon:yes gene_type:complete
MSDKIIEYKKMYTFKNPWLRYVAHKLNVIDKGLVIKYYNKVGHTDKYAKFAEGLPSDQDLNIRGLQAMDDICRMLIKVKSAHYGVSEELDSLYKSVEEEINPRKRKYNWRKHLKRDNKPFPNEKY